MAAALARLVACALALSLWASLASVANTSAPSMAAAPVEEKVEHSYGRLPLAFEANRGQSDRKVDFLSRGPGYSMFLTPREAVLRLADRRGPGAVLRMRLIGGNPRSKAAGLARLPGRTNYLKGNDPKRWRTGVRSYARVRYQGIYPGIDLVYYGKRGQLEYDFNVAPGADPKDIALAVKGAKGLTLDRRGDLLIHTRAGTVRQHKPELYQLQRGARLRVAGRYVLKGRRRVGFEVGSYDRRRPLIIDPVLTYSTFLGGTGYDFRYPTPQSGPAGAIAVDSAGSAYVTGFVESADFPVAAGALGSQKAGVIAGAFDAVVTKLNPAGSAVVYSTYLGGSKADLGQGIAVDAAGAAYVAGSTGYLAGGIDNDRIPFPTTAGAFQPSIGGPPCDRPCQYDAFLAKLNPQGSGLEYSTFLGGSANDRAYGVALKDGRAYVTGTTGSQDFPTTQSALDRVGPTGEGTDAFVAKVDPASSGAASLVYATYLGGTTQDSGNVGNAIDVDASGNAYVTGATSASDFPTTNGAFDRASAGVDDAYVAKLDPQGAGLAYSTYLGGTGSAGGEEGRGIAVDSAGSAYVTGSTRSLDFPTTEGAFDRTSDDGFVTKLDPQGGQLVYSTYLGVFRPAGIAVDAGNAYVTGQAATGFPVKDPVGRHLYDGAAAVTALNAQGSGLVYSVRLGGSGNSSGLADSGLGIAVRSGEAYVFGAAASDDFPTTVGAFQAELAGKADGFVAKLSPTDVGAPYVTGVSPPTGPDIGGTQVIISGRDLSGAGKVSFGGVPATSFHVQADDRIAAVSPPHPAGSPAVTVATAAGTSPPNPAARFAYGEGRWSSTGAPVEAARSNGSLSPRAVLLRNGRVLVADQARTTALLFDPNSESWRETAAPDVARGNYTLTALANGKALAVGAGAELYDPAADKWSVIQSPGSDRSGHTATLLYGPACSGSPLPSYCGKVLVAGGGGRAQLYNPTTGGWSPTAPMVDSDRQSHTATPLNGPECRGGSPPDYCGKILVAGGAAVFGAARDSAELYDPRTNAWRATGPLLAGSLRYRQLPGDEYAAALLSDGKVLLPGGKNFVGRYPSEVYDPRSGTWKATTVPPHGGVFSATANFSSPLGASTATLVPNGKVLLANVGEGADLFDTRLRTGDGGWTSAGLAGHGPDTSRNSAGAVLLSSDPLRFGPLSSDPSTVGAEPPVCGRNCGKVLVFGLGRPAATIYTPAPSVLGMSPASGPLTGGTSVTVRGTGFTHGLRSVTFGGVPARSFSVDSYSQVTAVAPPHALGSADVVVTNEGGTSSPSEFTFSREPASPPRDAGRCALTRRGTSRADRITGTNAGDNLLGLGGNDRISALSGDDCLSGGTGRDRLSGGHGADVLRGGSGRDRLLGGAGADRLSGGSGNDFIVGGGGKNRYSGGAGNDRIDSANSRRETVQCGGGVDTIRADRSDRLRGCERVRRGRRR